MKQFYSLCVVLLFSTMSFAQGYTFGIVYLNDYDFKVVAIPDFNSSGNTDMSDVGFTLVLPAGNADVVNANSLVPSRTWTVQQYDAAFLTGQGLGDGTKDVFLFNLPPGQTVFSHTANEQIDLVSFSISNSPTNGELTFLLNSDSIATGAGGVLDSFYNSNIDNTTTQDYFNGIETGMDNYMFPTLSITDNELKNFVEVFPNPTSDFFSINALSSVDFIEIFSITGKRVMISKLTENITVSGFSKGLYLVKINLNDNSSIVKKLIIE